MLDICFLHKTNSRTCITNLAKILTKRKKLLEFNTLEYIRKEVGFFNLLTSKLTDLIQSIYAPPDPAKDKANIFEVRSLPVS